MAWGCCGALGYHPHRVGFQHLLAALVAVFIVSDGDVWHSQSENLGNAPETLIIVAMDGNRSAPGPQESPKSTAQDPPRTAPQKPTTEQNNITFVFPDIWFSLKMI